MPALLPEARMAVSRMLTGARAAMAGELGSHLWWIAGDNRLVLPFLLLICLLQRWILSWSNWILVFVSAWAAFLYGRHKHKILLEELNNRWKRHILYTSPKTPLEPCEWLNKLMANLWPSYMEPKLSKAFSAIMTKRLKERKPQPFRSIELQEFSLGKVPPTLGLQRTYWTTEGDEQILYTGFEWETSEMTVLLAAKLGGPFKGMARFAINSLQIKGDLRIVPILDGQALVYSFKSSPEVRVGVAFGSGSQSLPATELPYMASWLEKLFSETLVRTMVEPRRKCFALPYVSMKKRAAGGVIFVTVTSAENLTIENCSRSDRKSYTNEYPNGGFISKQMTTFVEVTLEGLTRRTRVIEHNSAPRWNDSFKMILHESGGTIHFNVYRQGSSSVKYDFLGSCEVRVRYVEDGSTIFWAAGPGNCVLANRAENCGTAISMDLPIEECGDAKLSVKLLLKEWQFADGSRTEGDALNGALSGSLSSLSSFQTHTGRTLKITVVEGRNLAAKDRSGKSDPYVRLRYGKLERKTKTVKQDLNPIWKQTFEFPEIGGGEYLQLKCYDVDYLSNESLGSARINLEGLEDSSPKDAWIPLEKVPTGEIRLIIEAYNSESEPESSQNGSKGHAVDQEKGLLEIKLLEACDLVGADFSGTSDPFVSIHYGNERRTTKVIHKTLHPQWNQIFEFIETEKPLLLHVKDHNALLPAVNIGHCKVEYERLPTNQTVQKRIPLQGVKKGEICIEVTRRTPESHGQSTTHGLNAHKKLLKKSDKVQTLLEEVRNLTSAGDAEAVCKKLEEVEMVEDEKSDFILRLVREKELLLDKIKELEKVMAEPAPGNPSANASLV